MEQKLIEEINFTRFTRLLKRERREGWRIKDIIAGGGTQVIALLERGEPDNPEQDISVAIQQQEWFPDEYQYLRSNDIDDLQYQINNQVGDGWRCSGPLVYADTFNLYIQRMER